MMLGGVPFYLSKMNKSESVAQNIDRLLFAEDGELRNEFQSLYNSLYKNATNHIKIITALAAKDQGITRGDIVKQTKLASKGKRTLMLEELESCGFIRSYEPFSAKPSRTRNRAQMLSLRGLSPMVSNRTNILVAYRKFLFNS